MPTAAHLDLLITAKPQLDNADPSVRPPLIEKLRQVASLAESFTEQRPRSNKSWLQLSDELDQEGLFLGRYPLSILARDVCMQTQILTGVNLWNISGLVQKTPHDEGLVLVAARKRSYVS